jgi:GH25 family lysozyme M1 (1,4-beta-N-acetylmuramidase)
MAKHQKEPVILDISVWNGSINTSILKYRAHAVILRCQYGIYADSKFKQFRAQLQAAEVPWSPYLFWIANANPVTQIEKFMELTGHYVGPTWVFDGMFGAWIDVEEGSRPIWMTKAQFTAKFEEFVELFEFMTGLKPGVYTRKSWWDPNTIATLLPKNLPMPLWTAHWDTNNPLIPRDWLTVIPIWTLHQHSGDRNQMGSHFGLTSRDVDMNNYWSDIHSFNQVYGLSLKPLSEMIPVPEYVTVNVTTLNLRQSPNGTILGTTSKGKLFYPDGAELDANGNPWYYIGKKKKLYLAAWLTV